MKTTRVRVQLDFFLDLPSGLEAPSPQLSAIEVAALEIAGPGVRICPGGSVRVLEDAHAGQFPSARSSVEQVVGRLLELVKRHASEHVEPGEGGLWVHGDGCSGSCARDCGAIWIGDREDDAGLDVKVPA